MSGTRFVIPLVLLAAAQLAACQAAPRDQQARVANAVLPLAVRATFDLEAPGATVTDVQQSPGADGLVVFEISYTIDGRAAEIAISREGRVLSKELTVPGGSLPEIITSSVATHRPGSVIIGADLESEGGPAYYEVDVRSEGQVQELRLNPDGSLIVP